MIFNIYALPKYHNLYISYDYILLMTNNIIMMSFIVYIIYNGILKYIIY